MYRTIDIRNYQIQAEEEDNVRFRYKKRDTS